MEVYTCDSVSYVICRNLAFLMLDLETSEVLYSTLFCIKSKERSFSAKVQNILLKKNVFSKKQVNIQDRESFF